MDTRRPCPCCGHLVFDVDDGWPGSYAICPVCFWEDDRLQFRRPFMAGGANRVSLVEAQQNFAAYGACDQHGRRFVRPSRDDEPLDPDWRPVDPAVDVFEGWKRDALGPADPSVLCWWLPEFWGRQEREAADPDAFWDAITGLVAMPSELRFVHWSELDARVPEAAAALRRQLDRYAATSADFEVFYDE